MKKVIALLMVCGFAMTFVACGGGSKTEAESADSTATETPAVEPAPDTTSTDTTGTDTTTVQ
jgi:cytochrome oxidase Cu insertion factor (SCO1/SenC/PrrC family)